MKSEELEKIEEGALFVADAHYPHHGDAFLHLLKRLERGDLVVPQLFLMGDIFDLLFGYNDYIQTFSAEAIALLKLLSQKIDIYYFEGNHDFLLKNIFTNIKIYPREQQPVRFDLEGKSVGLSHGDKYGLGISYDLYCLLLRNRYLITALRPFGKWLIDDRIAKLKQKNICLPMEHFSKRAEKIMAAYSRVDMVIEGHYHQGERIGNYLSLPSLACQEKVAVVRDSEIIFVSMKEL